MANETILIVEDDTDLLENNCEYLTQKGYRTIGVETLALARQTLMQTTPALVLLDINLPDGSGFDLAAEIPPHIPILYLTGRTSEEDVIRGLSRGKGRVDYLRKPFGYGEMGARAAALLSAPDGMSKRHGPLVLDVASGRAYMDGEDMLLTQKQFSLLYILIQHEGEKLSAEMLYQEVWKQPLIGNSNAFWTQISRLKKKLESTGRIDLNVSRADGYWLEFSE